MYFYFFLKDLTSAVHCDLYCTIKCKYLILSKELYCHTTGVLLLFFNNEYLSGQNVLHDPVPWTHSLIWKTFNFFNSCTMFLPWPDKQNIRAIMH